MSDDKRNGQGTDKPWQKPGQSSQDPAIKPPPKRQPEEWKDKNAAGEEIENAHGAPGVP
jgi:hypothetical protein